MRANTKLDEDVKRLAADGYGMTEIAKELNVGLNVINNIARRLKRNGTPITFSRTGRRFAEANPEGARDVLVFTRRELAKRRMTAYENYKNNLAAGMSRKDAATAFLSEIETDLRVETERTTKETGDIDKLLALLDIVYAGIPDKEQNKRGPKLSDELYIAINEMKLLGFSVRETANILDTSVVTVNNYRQIHYRAYQDSETPLSFRSSGGRPSLRSSGATSLRATAPSQGETLISDWERRELEGIGTRSRMTEERLESLVITEKAEKDFTKAEYDEVNKLLDDSDKKLDKASEMLENKRMRLQDEQWNLQNLSDANKATDRQYARLAEVEELLEELERQEEILQRGYEANRLARLMLRSLRANSNNPRRDEYDNKYIIIRNTDGTLAGMTMWGFLGVDVTFNTPDVPYAIDAEALPPENRITGRMIFIDFLMSFQNVPGMGSYLFRRVLEDARGRNARKVFLETTDSSRPYWEQIGFRERRIAGSTSQYHEYVARVDEMLEAIESSSEETN